MAICPDSKIVVAPILPTKRDDWNARGIHFNQCLFEFENLCEKRFSTLDYRVFRDPSTGWLRSDLGSYWRPEDELHLGSRGIRVLVGMIRNHVFSSKISSNKTFSAALSGRSASGSGTGLAVAQYQLSASAAT